MDPRSAYHAIYKSQVLPSKPYLASNHATNLLFGSDHNHEHPTPTNALNYAYKKVCTHWFQSNLRHYLARSVNRLSLASISRPQSFASYPKLLRGVPLQWRLVVQPVLIHKSRAVQQKIAQKPERYASHPPHNTQILHRHQSKPSPRPSKAHHSQYNVTYTHYCHWRQLNRTPKHDNPDV